MKRKTLVALIGVLVLMAVPLRASSAVLEIPAEKSGYVYRDMWTAWQWAHGAAGDTDVIAQFNYGKGFHDAAGWIQFPLTSSTASLLNGRLVYRVNLKLYPKSISDESILTYLNDMFLSWEAMEVRNVDASTVAGDAGGMSYYGPNNFWQRELYMVESMSLPLGGGDGGAANYINGAEYITDLLRANETRILLGMHTGKSRIAFYGSSSATKRPVLEVQYSDPPTNVQATDGTYSDRVRISWSSVAGATAYEVWRHTSNSSGSATKIGDPTSSPFDDTTAVTGTTYYYWVKAKNAANTSGFSFSNSGYRQVSPPSAPTGVSASDGTYTDRVRVSWNSSSGATAYEVWRHTSNSSGSASKIGDPSSSPYDDTTAVAGTTYYYWVKAKNTGGTSGFSSSNSGYRQVSPPSAPTGVSASDGTYTDRVRVSWNSSSGATAYEVWRHTSNSSGSATKIGDPTSSPYDDTTTVAGTTYYYWLKAKNAGGTSGFSSSDSGYRRTPDPPPAPPPPSWVSASDGTYVDKVRVSWEDVAASEQVYYEVWRSSSANVGSAVMIADYEDVNDPPFGEPYYDDVAASPGTVYYYWIKSKHWGGTSGFSSSDSGYRQVNPPSAPTGVSASDGTYTDRVRVSWNSSSGATAYEVWRHTSNSSGSASKIGDPSSSPYDDTTAVAGTTYYYWVKASNAGGTSGFSPSDSGYRQVSPPSAPTGVSATDGTYTDKVRVSWNSSSGATAYEVWRHTSNSSGSASKIGDPSSSPYDDTTAVAGTTYYYWVKASNAGGTSGFSPSDSGYICEIRMERPEFITGGQVILRWNSLPGRSYTIRRTTHLQSGWNTRAIGVTLNSYTDSIGEEKQMFWMIIEEP
jgi:fibronectin type 3 domain-containing protein